MGDIKIRIDAVLNDEDQGLLDKIASDYGWLREEPRKPWTAAEHKEKCRFAMETLIKTAILEKKKQLEKMKY